MIFKESVLLATTYFYQNNGTKQQDQDSVTNNRFPHLAASIMIRS